MITLVGSGNVATWMAQRLQGSSRFPITQVYSRKLENARRLADMSGTEAIDDIKALNPDNQIFIFALADSAYESVLPQLPFRLPLAFLTSGTVSCQCLKDYADRYGVIYPLQTFTKSPCAWNPILSARIRSNNLAAVVTLCRKVETPTS